MRSFPRSRRGFAAIPRGSRWDDVLPSGPPPDPPANPPSTAGRWGLQLIAPGASSPPPPPPSSNVADNNLYWVDVLGPTGGGNPTGTIEDMGSDDLTFFHDRGMDAVGIVTPYTSLIGLGDDQAFVQNPIGANLSASQYHDARVLRDSVIPKCTAAGVKVVLITQLKNRNNPQILNGIFPPGGGTWNNDSSPSTISKLQDWAGFAKAMGCIGIMLDCENYPDNVTGASGEIWGGQEFVTQWRARGYEFGYGLAQVWPDINVATYHNMLPGGVEELTRGGAPHVYEPNYAGSGTGMAASNFWYGVTQGMLAAAPSGLWNLIFHEASQYYRGPCPTGYRQQDINGVCAWFSRTWPHWGDVHDHIGIDPFIWINKGVYVGGQPAGSQEAAYQPAQLNADKAGIRDWHMVTVNDLRVLQHYVYNAQLQMPFQTLDTTPVGNWPTDYQASLNYLTTPAVVSNAAPSLTITTPTNGSTSAASITTVAGTASDDFGVTAVTWVNAANGAKGHLAMDFVVDSGSYTTSMTWHMNLSISGAAPVIPLAMGTNVITFTVRDSKGATTQVVRTITRV